MLDVAFDTLVVPNLLACLLTYYFTDQGKLALAVRAQQSAVARAEAQARARAAAERAEAAARADLGVLHAALASHGIELHYEPG